MVAQNQHILITHIGDQAWLLIVHHCDAFKVMVGDPILQQCGVEIVRAQAFFRTGHCHTGVSVDVSNAFHVVARAVNGCMNNNARRINRVISGFDYIAFNINFNQIGGCYFTVMKAIGVD